MQYLIGRQLPDIELEATRGSPVNPARLRATAVLFCYPYTGRPNVPDPPDWDRIPGAHGSTPQAIAYSKTYERFRTQNVDVFGISFQDSSWQREFSLRRQLRFTLLSDEYRKFAEALDLPCFSAGSQSYLKRLTLIVESPHIVHVRFPIEHPQEDAEQALRWFEDR